MIKYLLCFLVFVTNLVFGAQAPGVAAQYYYNASNLTGSSLTVAEGTTTGVDVIHNNWAAGTPAAISSFNPAGNLFSIRYTGYIRINVSGRYTFTITNDDGGRLYLDCNATGYTSMASAPAPSTLLINKWVDQSAASTSGSCANTFTAGEYYKYVLEYYENGGDAVIGLQWQAKHPTNNSAVLAQQYLPSGNLAGNAAGSYYDNILLATNFSSVQTSCAIPRQLYLNFDGVLDTTTALNSSNYTVGSGITVTKSYLVPGNKGVILTLNTDLPIGNPVNVTVTGLKNNSGVVIPTKTISATYAGGKLLAAGTLGSYFNQNNTAGAYFSGVQTDTIDSQINFNWGVLAPTGVNSDYFSVSWNGYIKFPSSKSFNLTTTTDDGVRLYVDPTFGINTSNGTSVLSQWVAQSATSVISSTFSNYDSSVYVPIRMEYYEQAGYASAVLSWSSTDGTLPTTVVPSGSFFYCSTPTGIPVGFNVAESVENPVSGHIYTKLSNTAFTLKISALKDTNSDGVGDSVETNYAITGDKTLKIDLVDRSSGSSCSSSPTIQTQNIVFQQSNQVTDLGQKTVSFNIPNAYKNLAIRITDSINSIVSCSTDNFSVRPSSFTISSTASNGTNSGTPIIKTGSSFTVTADTGASLYTGIPSISPLNITAHSGAIRTGTLSGNFISTSAGLSSGSYTYSEVGNFAINAGNVIDTTWTAIDNPGDCTINSSNIQVGGKYGCYVDNKILSPFFGRFVPDHFKIANVSLSPRADYPTCTGTFNYIGEDIKWSFDLLAQDNTNSTTQNYTGSYNKLLLSNNSSYTLRANNGSVLSTNIVSTSGSMTNGQASGVSIIGNITRLLPVNSFSANWGLSILDSDNISTLLDADLDSLTGNDSTLLTSSLSHRYGILKTNSITGNNKTVLKVPVQILYRNANAWSVNTADQCTSFGVSNIAIGNINSILNSEISVNSVSTILSGILNINLSSTHVGRASFDVAIQNNSTLSVCNTFTQANTSNSSVKTYLSSNTCGVNYDKDISAKVSLGIVAGGSPIVYFQEKY